jgi:uncharacterized membrane protein YecN with MAPEG domain
MNIVLAENGASSGLAGAIAFFFFVSGFSVFVGVLLVAAGMNQQRRNTASGKIAIGIALTMFGLIMMPLAYFLLNVLGR